MIQKPPTEGVKQALLPLQWGIEGRLIIDSHSCYIGYSIDYKEDKERTFNAYDGIKYFKQERHLGMSGSRQR